MELSASVAGFVACSWPVVTSGLITEPMLSPVDVDVTRPLLPKFQAGFSYCERAATHGRGLRLLPMDVNHHR